MIDIPCHPEFIQDVKDDVKVNINDNEHITKELSEICQGHVKDITDYYVNNLLICLQRCINSVSVKQMLEGFEETSFRQLRRKYLQALLDMELIEMTLPDKPTSRNQKYVLSAKGKELLKNKKE